MARSAFVEVNITNPTKLAQDSQDTADNAVKGVTDLNDPNLMSVIEKQNNVVQFAGLTSQYSVLIQNAKDDGIDTTAVTMAYNNLNRFMADILADPNHASDIDRARYKKYQDAYNEELVNLQNALQNNTNDKFTSAASALSQAASTANVAKSAADSTYAYANSEIAAQSTATAKAQSAADGAFSQAQVVGSQADSAIAVQSTATAKAQSAADNAFNKAQEVGSQATAEIAVQSNATTKAQSTADNAFSQATTAIDNGQAVSQAVTSLKDGSTLTIAELGNGLASKVSNSEYASYQTQTASQIASKVDNGDFSTYKTQTADLISQKVATKDFSAYQDTTAKAINSKVESNDFNTYKTQTASQIASKVDNGDFSTYKTQTADLISSKVANKDFTAYQDTTAKSIESKVESKDFNTYKTQTADMISSKVESKDFQALQTQVDNSTVGTNLLENTADNGVGLVSIQGDNSIPAYSAPMTRNSSYIEMTNATGSELYYRFCNTDSSMHNLKPGQTYTIQGEVYVSKGAVRFRSQNEVNGGWTDYSGCASGDLATNTSGFAHVNYTFTVPSNATAFYLSWQVYNFDSTTVFRFRRMKLEIGSNATDYSTNPLDQATQSQITQLSGDINLRVTKGDLIDEINLQAGNTLISSSGQLTLSGKSVFLDSVDPVIMKSANIDTLLVGKKLTAADIAANTFTTNNGTFTVDSNGLVTATSLIIRGSTNLVYNSALSGGNGTYIPGWTIGNNGTCWPGNMHDGVPSIGWHNTATGWTTFAQTKLVPLNGAVGIPFSASVWFLEYGSDTSLQYSLNLSFFDSNGNRISFGEQHWNGIGSKQDWRYITIDNAVAPSNAVSVGLQYWAYNGKGNACFSSPMLTQTSQSTGYQPDAGNVVSAGTVLGSIISGSTINATTFNGGDLINNANNTSNFYPFTIEPTGKASTTLFNSMDALRTEMSGGGLRTMYRAINASGSQYEAYDGNFSGDAISLNSGFTNGRDTSFSQSVSGNQLTGQVVLSPLNGIHLWGSTQAIHFSGLQMNGTGITFNSYGNIIADQASAWWRVTNFSGSDIANFGTDTAGSNVIQFNRELDIGNIQINTGHTVTSADKGAIHFAKGGGGTVDIYAGAVHYTSLVNSSLLSVKRDVKKADTAYWAQLVNAIDLATYQYKTDDNTSHIRLSGIVDDVNETKQWQLPDIFINRDENGKLSGVDNSVLLNAALATIQEQQKQISTLNGHNMELESRLNKLEDKIK